MTDQELDQELERRGLIAEFRTVAPIALAMVGRSSVSFEVLKQWIGVLRAVRWPGPTFLMPEIYAAGAWIGVVPLRNLVTYTALKDRSWDYLLWVDADHKLTPGIFGRLQEHAAAGRPVVGGLYYGRSYPFEVQAFAARDPGGVLYVPPQVLVPALYPPRSEVIPVAGVGTGCMLIRRDVLERMAERRGAGNVWRADRVPWEEQVKLLDGGEDISGVMSEDILFCLDVADELGEQVWLDLDPRMETGHQGEETRDRRHYLASHQLPAGIDPRSVAPPPGYHTVDPNQRLVNQDRERARRLKR